MALINTTKLKILYFLQGMNPSREEMIEIQELGFPVQLRNAEFATSFEPCDGVLGAVPELFKKMPDGVDAFEKASEHNINELKKRGEELPNTFKQGGSPRKGERTLKDELSQPVDYDASRAIAENAKRVHDEAEAKRNAPQDWTADAWVQPTMTAPAPALAPAKPNQQAAKK